MPCGVVQVDVGQPPWPHLARLFPRAVRWMNDPNDHGDCRFFAAADGQGAFLGGAVIDLGPMRFGPLAAEMQGFLEDIEVLPEFRRRGVGKALLRAALDHAWAAGCRTVRWTVGYENAAGIALYRSLACGFIPEEDPASPDPERCYAVVAINPAVVAQGYGRTSSRAE